jgi:hypothetical protein
MRSAVIINSAIPKPRNWPVPEPLGLVEAACPRFGTVG